MEATSPKRKLKVQSDGRLWEEGRSRQHSRKTLFKALHSCLSFKLASRGKYIHGPDRTDILRLPNAPHSLFLIFLNWHCHALTSQSCMISPSPFQLQYPSAVETVRLHLHIPNNPALNNERFAI